jgi:hypothetical protein
LLLGGRSGLRRGSGLLVDALGVFVAPNDLFKGITKTLSRPHLTLLEGFFRAEDFVEDVWGEFAFNLNLGVESVDVVADLDELEEDIVVAIDKEAEGMGVIEVGGATFETGKFL